MGTKTNHILSRPIYLYLYGLSFLVFKASAYFASVEWLTLLSCLFLYCAISYFFVFLLKKITKPVYAGIPVLIVWISIMHVVGISQVFGYSYSSIPLRFYVCFYCSVFILLFIACWVFLKISSVYAILFNQIANVFLSITTIVFLANGYQRAEKEKVDEQLHFHSHLPETPIKKHQDILWILMDEYASSASLKQQFSFHNPLDSFLEKNHFTVLPEMRTRFANTLFSVNSIFNMDDSIEPTNFYAGINLLRHGSLIPEMERLKYRFINLGFFNMEQHPMIADRSGYPYNYLEQLLSGTAFTMLYNKWKHSIKKCDSYNQEVLQRLNDSLSVSSTTPRFIWAHLPIPHTPFCRDKEGRLLTEDAFVEDDSVVVKRKYIEYLEYGNKAIVSLLSKHPDLSSKIVIISGDHGPRYGFLQNRAYSKWPFVAVFVPGQYDTVGLKKLNYISQLPGFLLQHLSR
jgi:hypothetical protein